jgi:hypothetical protein
MRVLLPIAALMALSTTLPAEEKLIEGGLSPDKDIGVYLVGEKFSPGDTQDYRGVEVRRERDHKVLGSFLGDSYTTYFNVAYEQTNAFWSADSRFFAFLFRSTKRTRSVSVYCVADGTLTEVKLPDYAPSMGQRIKGFGGRYFWPKAVGWRGHEMSVRITGNIVNGSGDPSAPDWYECSVVIQIDSHQKAVLRDVVVHKQPVDPKDPSK